jgi:hypothetical protein
MCTYVQVSSLMRDVCQCCSVADGVHAAS